LGFDLFFFDSINPQCQLFLLKVQKRGDGESQRTGMHEPFIFQPIPQFENLNFNISLPIMLQNLLVRLPLAMLEAI
jgi:hypothetical protein